MNILERQEELLGRHLPPYLPLFPFNCFPKPSSINATFQQTENGFLNGSNYPTHFSINEATYIPRNELFAGFRENTILQKSTNSE